ncbi:MAG: penicillin-binding protein activator LpoB [Treponema sp.]|jgi:TolB-like protein|nr:penicillin-binding protein activator LpoB [Treponema sp.]
MKKIGIAILLCLTGLGAFAQNITLDEAIQAAATEMGQRLPQGGKVAVLSFTSTSERFSKYVIDELNNAIVNEGNLTVVDRQQLDLIMQEMQFQESGLVSDESAQEIGRMLGAQYIVSGSMELVASSWRFRTRALTVENATIAYSGSRNVANDRTVSSLMGGSGEEIIVDYTTAERNRARWLNLLWGVGSFSQGDTKGGIITAVLDTVGFGALIAGTVHLLTYDVPAVYMGADSHTEFNGILYDTSTLAYAAQDNYIAKKNTFGFIIVGSGAAVLAAGWIYGFVRPSSYHKAGYVAQGPMDPTHWDLALVSDSRGDPGLRLSYKLSF